MASEPKKLFPSLKKRNAIWVHGHRGSAATHPENSFFAIEEAFAAGADFFEVDVHLTNDDVAIIFHDKSVSGRVCRDKEGNRVRIPIPVRQLNADDLKDYDCGQVANRRFPERQLMPGTPIPTLEAVLDWMHTTAPELGINIEVKIPHHDTRPVYPEVFADQVVARIRQYDMVGRVQFQSFNSAVLKTARELCPELALSLLCHTSERFVERAVSLKASIVGPYFKLLTPKKVAQCHEAGLLVVPYTVNSEEDWQELLDMGVDGLITDYPRKLVSFLKSYNGGNSLQRVVS